MKKSTIWTGLATVALMAPLAGPASAAPSAGAEFSDDIAASRAFMTEYGVDTSVQDELIALTLAGGLPLSDVEGAAPESVERVESVASTVDILRYADGSVSVVEVQKGNVAPPKGAIAPRAVTGCSYAAGSGYANYSNCKVHYRSAVFSFGFYANFSIHPGANNDKVSWAGNKFLEYSVGHMLTSSSAWVEQSVESTSRNASAVYTATFDLWPGIGSVTRGTRLWVGDNTYWQES